MIYLRSLCTLFILVVLGACAGQENTKNTSTPITQIAFGSCSRENLDNQRWDDILRHDPDLYIWLGDNIYGDTQDMLIMAEKYKQQRSRPGYRRLLQSDVQIIGTWDDHDYGTNDGGKFYAKKEESKHLMLDFLEVDKDNPVYGHEGVYQAYDYEFDRHKLKVILLDTRWFRDTIYWDNTDRKYLPNSEGDILGEDQWAWFEQELAESEAEINIIGSSIQVIPEEHGYEKWSNFPAARQRLFDLLLKYPEKKTIFISGDRHIAEISRIDLPGLTYPLYDFTSSGLTHTWRQSAGEPNPYRVSKFNIALNYGIIRINWNTPGNDRISLQIYSENSELIDEVKVSFQ